MKNNFLSVSDWSAEEHKSFLDLTDKIKSGAMVLAIRNGRDLITTILAGKV